LTRRGYNLVGEKFDKLTVIRKGDTLNKKVLWECLCDCGKTSKVRTNDLTSGRIISCGCENDKRIGDLRRSHGLTNSPLYSVWAVLSNVASIKIISVINIMELEELKSAKNGRIL